MGVVFRDGGRPLAAAWLQAAGASALQRILRRQEHGCIGATAGVRQRALEGEALLRTFLIHRAATAGFDGGKVTSSHYVNKFASCDSLLDHILVIFIGRDIFFNVNKGDEVETEDFHMVMRKNIDSRGR